MRTIMWQQGPAPLVYDAWHDLFCDAFCANRNSIYTSFAGAFHRGVHGRRA